MAVLFVSHSSRDDTQASALEAWLRDNGFAEIFVDHHAIAGGDKWREELRASAGSCRVVLCLVTENWLTSHECFNEFRAAWYMGKRIIPLFRVPAQPNLDAEGKTRLAEVCAEDQGIDLDPCIGPDGIIDLKSNDDVASRLKIGLRAAGAITRVGLDPEAFAIDRKLRPRPFPGLASFGDEDADAALFYGRSREIAHTLEELRKMRAERDLRPFVILGASGAGKSSLLKAGVIPRLRREAPAWLPLRAFRPGADPLLNFAESLARTLMDFGRVEAYGVIRDRLLEAWSAAERAEDGELAPGGLDALAVALDAEGRKLREVAGASGATILVSVDQAEEMARADDRSGQALADYLRVALALPQPGWQLAFTIRTDSFPELQRHHRFQKLEARGYDLRAIPVFRFDSVVLEPAKRYGVEIETHLVDALMDDAPKEDALPLLAFTMQRLWRLYAASGALTRKNYDNVGALKGLIEDAAERALRGLEPEQDVPLPSGAPAQRLVDLAASTFVPALAQISDQGATIRRIAAWSSFSDEQQELLGRFDRWRLMVRKGTEVDGGTVEVAHEALFREWARLKEWLEPERARLEALRSLQLAAGAWERHGRKADFLDHRDTRLAEAGALTRNDAYRKRLTAPDFDYLAACGKAERAARGRTQRVRALIYLLLVGIIAGLVGWINQSTLKEQFNWVTTMRPYMLANVRPYVLAAEAEAVLKSSDSFRECAQDCPEMIVMPAGEFTMGSPKTEAGRYDDEGPQHKVTIAKPFAVSRFDVTFADWDACVAVGGCPRVSDGSLGRGTRPVINVTWDEARLYVAWLSLMTGKPYRLLSEAEWEYAARAGTTTAYWWGDEIGQGNANCEGCGSKWENQRTTAPVGSFKPNAYGLYDMAGNVWQWVEDCYQSSYDGAPTDGSARTADDCEHRVIRGGSWRHEPRMLRSAARVSYTPVVRYDALGFRIARTLAR